MPLPNIGLVGIPAQKTAIAMYADKNVFMDMMSTCNKPYEIHSTRNIGSVRSDMIKHEMAKDWVSAFNRCCTTRSFGTPVVREISLGNKIIDYMKDYYITEDYKALYRLKKWTSLLVFVVSIDTLSWLLSKYEQDLAFDKFMMDGGYYGKIN